MIFVDLSFSLSPAAFSIVSNRIDPIRKENAADIVLPWSDAVVRLVSVLRGVSPLQITVDLPFTAVPLPLEHTRESFSL